MTFVHLITLLGVGSVLIGCRNSGESVTSSLGASNKLEGFLAVKEIVADSSKAGSYLVTCASMSGTDKTVSYTLADVEQNKICLAPAAVAAPSVSPSPVAGVNPAPASGYKATRTQLTYIKSQPNKDVTRDGATMTRFKDYCVVDPELQATTICSYSATEYKASGVTIAGCDIKEGYLFKSHFTVAPTVSACK